MFENTTILVSGGSRGIGAATAVMAAGRGANVFVNYRSNDAAAKSVVAACHDAGGRAEALAGDVSDEDDVLALFAACSAAFGAPDCLVNNAGILHQLDRVENYTAERIFEVVNVNIVGAFLCACEAVRVMSTTRGGRGGTIVNVSSAASPSGVRVSTSTTRRPKGAMDTMTIGLSKEVAAEGHPRERRPSGPDRDRHPPGRST